jgi:TIR domain-containing protein
MPFFIGYSDKDESFVDRLAAQLAFRRRNVWVDRWELKIGDSILNRIQKALTEASGLIHIGQSVILTTCADFIADDELQLLLCDDGVSAKEFAVGDVRSVLRYTVTVRCRRLGKPTGNDVLYDVGAILWLVRDTLLRHTPTLKPSETLAMLTGLSTVP